VVTGRDRASACAYVPKPQTKHKQHVSMSIVIKWKRRHKRKRAIHSLTITTEGEEAKLRETGKEKHVTRRGCSAVSSPAMQIQGELRREKTR
jgi:hypothetical protein